MGIGKGDALFGIIIKFIAVGGEVVKTTDRSIDRLIVPCESEFVETTSFAYSPPPPPHLSMHNNWMMGRIIGAGCCRKSICFDVCFALLRSNRAAAQINLQLINCQFIAKGLLQLLRRVASLKGADNFQHVYLGSRDWTVIKAGIESRVER